MKAVKIERYEDKRPESHYTRDKSFWVYLGNGSKRSFTNKKHLTKFLAETNEFMKQNLFELNRIYAEIFAEYRKIWFYFDAADLKSVSQRFDDDLIFVNKSFNMMVERAGWTNGNHFVFKDFYYIIIKFTEIVNTMIEVQRSKSNYVEKRNLEVITSRLQDMKNKIENYAK